MLQLAAVFFHHQVITGVEEVGMEARDDGSLYWFHGIRWAQPDCASLPLRSKDGGKTCATSPGDWAVWFRVALAARVMRST